MRAYCLLCGYKSVEQDTRKAAMSMLRQHESTKKHSKFVEDIGDDGMIGIEGEPAINTKRKPRIDVGAITKRLGPEKVYEIETALKRRERKVLESWPRQ